MTLVAGVYARRADEAVPDSICNALRNQISRHPGEARQEFYEDRCYIVKTDIGAFGERAFRIDIDAATAVVGEPLLEGNDSIRRSRSLDVDEIHSDLLRGSNETLKKARGVFCVAQYQRSSRALLLATDKLGVRPLYYSVTDRFVIFASAIRILENIPEVAKAMDVRGVTEENALGYAIGDRTGFTSIRLLKAGELFRVNAGSTVSDTYWRWDRIQASAKPPGQLVDEARAGFLDAIALRSGTDSTTVAFLSGGLDSRAIVTALRDRGLYVHTFNFSVTGLQDQVFGAAFARAVGTNHLERPMKPTQSISARIMADAWNDSPHRESHPAERPGLVWSGDGGSVTLGHVYLNKPMVDAARAGDVRRAMELSENGWGSDLPRRLLRSELIAALEGKTPRDGLAEEFDALETQDPGRALHLVLMHNDQRRHMAAHFEAIDLSRLEYQLPFFDGAFVESVLRIPLDYCLGHRLYMDWLRGISAAALSVPWQAYPGHEPCLLPIPPDVRYQWSEDVSRIVRAAEYNDLLAKAGPMLADARFPSPLIRRSYLRLAKWAYRLRISDLGYVIRAAQRYYDYWVKCEGRYELPS